MFHLLTSRASPGGLLFVHCIVGGFLGGLEATAFDVGGTGQVDDQPAHSFSPLDLVGVGPRAYFRGPLVPLIICE